MTINISLPEKGRGQTNLRPLITIIGVGGAGGNAINNMISSNLEGVDFLVTNTDAQALESSTCERRIQLGLNSTQGLGAGMRPNLGKEAAEEAAKDIEEKLEGINMAFIAAGMGGGTGTGASPVIAKIAREKGILTVGVVTKPFHFEGIQRMRLADQGIEELEQHVDTLLIIPNQNLFKIANERTTFSDAFKMADDVLYAGVRGVTDLMVMPGLINLDFSDVKTVMSEMGKSMMGIGQAEGSQGESRAIKAAEAAIANPLIDDVSLKGAKGLIINITGGKDLTLYEVDEAANRIREEVDVDANIIFGSTCDERLEGVMRVSIVATGIQGDSISNQKPIEKPSINIDNSVYKKPIKSEGLSLYSSLRSEEKIEASEIKKPQELDNIIQNKSENNISTEEPTSTEEHLYDLNNDHQEIEKVVETSELEDGKLEENYSSISQNVDKSSSSEQNLDEPHSSNGQNSQETHVRRLSLFDVDNSNLDNHQKNKIDSLKKKEPFLDTMETNMDKAENNAEEGEGNNLNYEENFEENTVMEDIENEISQEEELLDVPTFLRRQAN